MGIQKVQNGKIENNKHGYHLKNVGKNGLIFGKEILGVQMHMKDMKVLWSAVWSGGLPKHYDDTQRTVHDYILWHLCQMGQNHEAIVELQHTFCIIWLGNLSGCQIATIFTRFQILVSSLRNFKADLLIIFQVENMRCEWILSWNYLTLSISTVINIYQYQIWNLSFT